MRASLSIDTEPPVKIGCITLPGSKVVFNARFVAILIDMLLVCSLQRPFCVLQSCCLLEWGINFFDTRLIDKSSARSTTNHCCKTGVNDFSAAQA